MTIRWWDDDYSIWNSYEDRNHFRNEVILQKKTNLKVKKTGTTIAGIIYSAGVILASDTRATNNGISCDKNCCKIHFLTSNICCCGAGTSGDIEFLTQNVSFQLEYHKLTLGRQAIVRSAAAFFKKI